MPSEHVIKITSSGKIQFIYSDQLAAALRKAGHLEIMRASHVEPDKKGQWWAKLSPVKGPRLGPYKLREKALSAEIAWLEKNYLGLKGKK